MTLQEQKLKVALTEVIQKWIDENCDTEEWSYTGIIVHEEAAEDMSDAAYSVFQAIHKSQRYGKDNGYFEV